MSSLKNLISLNIARFNRIRRKPLLEILTFLAKRSRQATIHVRDRIRMTFGEIQLSDKKFFGKLSLENSSLMKVKKALEEENLDKAKAELIAYMRARATPVFYFNRNERKMLMSALEEHFPQSKKATIELAEKILRHEFDLLGERITFSGDIDWHFNASNNERWPLSFSPNIDYFSSNRRGDIKIPWELNRTQHFVVLGKAYWCTGDEKYAKEFADQLLSWIRDNPYKIGINWMEGIEAAIRMLSWIWSYHFFLDSEHFHEKAHIEFLKCTYMHANFINKHLSDKWRINNNHLIAEAAGLVIIGIMFPEFKEAEIWTKKGVEILEKELKTQILPDGFTWEQSTGYHKFVTDLVLHVAVLMMKNRMEIPETILQKLGQMIESLNYVAKPDERIPLVGDEDQGRVVKLSEADCDYARPIISCGGILLGREDWKKCEENLWMFGTRSLTEKSINSQLGSRIFEDSGFMVMRDRDKYMLFSVGPRNSKYSYASHKHMDELSLVLDAYGTTFLVDPGTYTYFGDFEWRKYFKSRKAHNAVVIDDIDAVAIEEIFESSSTPMCEIQDFATGDKLDWISARYYGYKFVSHMRQVFFIKPEYWIIVDMIQGRGEHVYDLYFHFDHKLQTKFNNHEKSVTAANLESRLKIVPLVNPGLNAEILRGEVSPRYGEKFRADILRYRLKGHAPQSFVSVLYPYMVNNESSVEAAKISQIDVYGKNHRMLDGDEATGIKIDFGGFQDYLVCSFSERQYFQFEGVPKREGKVIYVRWTPKKIIKEVVL